MQQIEISNGKFSNATTRSLGLTVDAPLSVVLGRKIYEYPNYRKKALEELSDDLDAKYHEAELRAKREVDQKRDKLVATEIALTNEREDKIDSIDSVKAEIQYYTERIDSLSDQIKKDVRAIRWMNTWRVIWGILCTAGIVVVGMFIVVGFIFKVIGFFMPKDNDDD